MWISYLLFVSCFVVYSYGQSNAGELCRRATSSCGLCTKAHADCAWCTDRSFHGEHRCDTKENLRQTCAGQLVHQPPSKIDITQDRPLGSQHPVIPNTVQQVQPQQFQLTMKPGETLTFPMKYQHMDSQNAEFYILHSDTKSQGVSITFTNNCPSHRQTDQDGRGCSGARPQEVITYNISVTLQDCVTAGDAVVSVGVTGVRDVVALYITPVCGCECEKLEFQEKQSPSCSGYGNLMCGVCVCTGGREGKQCECDPSRQSCATLPTAAAELPIDSCAGRTCPSAEGRVCSGRGQCDCGRCVCYHGWEGHTCQCPSNESCKGPDGRICSGKGACECGVCSCDDESVRTTFCEEDDLPKVPDDMVDPHMPSHTEGPDPHPNEHDAGHEVGPHDPGHVPTDEQDEHKTEETGDETEEHEETTMAPHHPIVQPDTASLPHDPHAPAPEPDPVTEATVIDETKGKARDDANQGSLISKGEAPRSRSVGFFLSIVLILVGCVRLLGSL